MSNEIIEPRIKIKRNMDEEILKLVRASIKQAVEAYMINDIDDGIMYEDFIKDLMKEYNIPEDIAFGKEKESGSGNS